MQEDEVSEDTQRQADFLDGLDDHKQETYEKQVCRAICKNLGMKATDTSALDIEASNGAGPQEGFTPEWLSQRLGSPITFRAIRDWRVAKNEKGFPDPSWLFSNDVAKAVIYRRVWKDIWQETINRFRGSGTFVAAVFKPKWSKRHVVIHDYEPVWLHGYQATEGVRQFAMFRRFDSSVVVMQELKDLLSVLSDYWTPNV